MSSFECKARREPEHVRLSLFGELDIAAAPRVDEALAEIEGEGHSRIVLDLRGLTFLDSTGLRSLLSADSRAREQDRRVTLIQGPEAVQRVFSITGLDSRLEIVEDERALAPESG